MIPTNAAQTGLANKEKTRNMSLSLNRDALGRCMGTLRATLWRVGAIPYNTVVVLASIAIMAQSRVWSIRNARH
jgi:hypothetical protein